MKTARQMIRHAAWVLVSIVVLGATANSARAQLVSSFEEYIRANVWWYTEDDQTDNANKDFRLYDRAPRVDGLDHDLTATWGDSTATVTTNYSRPDESTLVLSTTWNFVRGADSPFGNSTNWHGVMFLVPEVDLAYSITGHFVNSGGQTGLDAALSHYPPPNGAPDVFVSTQHSWYAGHVYGDDPFGPAHYVIADGGNYQTYLHGSLTGILRRGELYTWGRGAYSAVAMADGGATAYGEATLTLTALNAHPVAVAVGPSEPVHCTDTNTPILLDGSGSSDPDGDELEFVWSVGEDSGVVLEDADQPLCTGYFPLGAHEVTLTVYDLDAAGERKTSAVTSVLVVVVDDSPPVALVTTDLAALQPANNKLMPVLVMVQASDECTHPDDLSLYCTVSSSQPDDTDGNGEHIGDVDGQDGYMAPVEVLLEPVGNGAYHGIINLRAERDGAVKEGRTYSIKLEVMDASGNLSTASTAVVVPRSGKKVQ